MKNLLVFKNLLSAFLCAFLLSVSCTSGPDKYLNVSADENARLQKFEEEFVANRTIESRNANPYAIQLLGFTSVEYFDDDKAITKEVWEKAADEIAATKCTFTTFDGSYMRIYYPLKAAAVTYKGKTYVADEDGIVVIDNIKNLSDIRIVGRKASETIVPNNEKVLKDGNVMLSRKLLTKNIYEDQKTLVFDMGYRYQDCCKTKKTTWRKSRYEEEDDDEDEESKVSCTKNHGNYSNCTVAFPSVATGRCITYYDRCMDYNGYNTDCSGSHRYFTGSDCFWAVARGECWNEI